MSSTRHLLLIVDDNPDFLDAIVSLLEYDERYETLFATNGLEALEVLKTRTPDLLITDLAMPEMTGFELIEQARQRSHLQNMRIILLTADTTPEKIHRGKQLGVSEYVIKPFMPGDLLEILERILE